MARAAFTVEVLLAGFVTLVLLCLPASASIIPCESRRVQSALRMAAGSSLDDFVKVVNGSFVLSCQEFVFAGANVWDLVQNASDPGKISTVNATLDALVSLNITVVRMWPFPVRQPLQELPGIYNESLFRALDYVLMQCKRRGLRTILPLLTYWTPYDSVPAFAKWCNLSSLDVFFSDDCCSRFYQGHIQVLSSRVNHLSGISYKNDSTIFAWDLLNEPRCESAGCSEAVQAWVQKQSSFLKTQVPNQLVTTGFEGFYSNVSSHASVNPGEPWGDWASHTGQDFIQNHMPETIDFAVAHLWPDNWIGNQQPPQAKLRFLRKWIFAHNQDAFYVLKKPLVWEEFGKQNEVWNGTFYSRDIFLQAIYQPLNYSMWAGGSVKGTAFWVFNSPVGQFGYTTTPNSTTMKMLKPFLDSAASYQQR